MTVTIESVTKAYRRQARYYDYIFGRFFYQGRKVAIEQLDCKPGDRILEVGVGTGLSLAMYPPDVKVVGIDLSKDMLALARERLERKPMPWVENLLQMDAQNMNFEDQAFDKVVAMYVASVVPDPARLMSEMRRVCKPEGKMVFINHFQSNRALLRKMESIFQPLAQYLGFHPEFPIEEFLAKTHFQVDRAIPVNALDYWTVLVGRNHANQTSE